MRQASYLIDEELLDKFKERCFYDGVPMKQRIEEFIRKFLKEVETQNTQKQPEPNLEILAYIDSNLNTMTKEELKNTNLKLQEVYETATPATRQLIQGYAARIKQRYTEISG